MSQKPTVIEVLCGLPGSGKTTWAREQMKGRSPYFRMIYEDSPNKLIIADMDSYMKSYNKGPKSIEANYLAFFGDVDRQVRGKSTGWRVIIDGLFLTHKDHLRVAQYFKDYDIIFHWWTPDRETCAFNDKYRRKEDSKAAIMNAIIDEPDVVAIKLASGSSRSIDKKRHDVRRKSGYQLFKDRYGIGDSFQSEEWSNGGTHNDCYGNTYTSSAEAPVACFANFDELIEKIDENISFMKYKKLYNASVSTETESSAGYYGGSRTNSYFRCDVRNLYDKLVELDILPEEFW